MPMGYFTTVQLLALHYIVLLFYTIKEIHIIQWYQQVWLCECQYLSHTWAELNRPFRSLNVSVIAASVTRTWELIAPTEIPPYLQCQESYQKCTHTHSLSLKASTFMPVQINQQNSLMCSYHGNHTWINSHTYREASAHPPPNSMITHTL